MQKQASEHEACEDAKGIRREGHEAHHGPQPQQQQPAKLASLYVRPEWDERHPSGPNPR